MKIIKPYISIILALSIGINLLSCTDFLDVNNNPNNPPESTPSLSLPVAQQNLAALNARAMTYLGQFMAYNWSTPSNWAANEGLIKYNITSTFYTSLFESSYLFIFKDLTYIENFTDPDIDYSAYKVISAVLKGFQYQYLVDIYGDIPYTEANQRGENTTPAYDDAETVYKSVIQQLTEVVSLALNLPDNAENPSSQDIIFNGDMTKWAKWANTIKLRMLVRMSNTEQNQYIEEQIALIDANGLGYITEDVVAQPGYSDDSRKQSPFYGYFVNPSTGSQTDRGDFTVATDYTIDYLTKTNDNRIERLYAVSKNDGIYKGAEQTTTLPGVGFTSDDLSKVGPGLLKSSEQDQAIMTLSEALLLQAEAAHRGYISGGEAKAKDLYQKAIEASFIYLGVEDASNAAKTYYTQSINKVSWDDSSNKLEAIIVQKWIALNGTSSIELWIEKTRTDFPSDLPISKESKGVRPLRLLYPNSERARNSDNVPTQTNQDAFTQNPFWK
ncbi:MAG: SusD/RagB family nutrient-binding outer membrane lipoprotein [Tenacibaculum sp.]